MFRCVKNCFTNGVKKLTTRHSLRISSKKSGGTQRNLEKKSVKIIKQEVTFKITLKTKIQTQLEAAALELQWLRSWAPPAGYCSGLLTRCARLAKTPLYNYITLLKWEPFYFLQLFLIVAGVLFRYLGCGLYCAVEKRCGCRDKCMASSCSVFFLVWSCCSD